MSLKDKKPSERKDHVHNWMPDYSLSEQRCSDRDCHARLISQAEFDARVEEWDAFYKFVTTTDSYRDYMSLRNGLGDRTEIMKRAQARLDKDEYMEKPKIFDPRGGSYIVA